jgi:DNA-binding SARP family transcriptional activator
MRTRAARELHNGGRHVRAAGLALKAGEYALAAACLDATGRRNRGEVVSSEYHYVAERLPLDAIFRSQYIFLELLCNRRIRARPYPLLARVRDFCESMTADSEPLVRFSARVAYTSLLRQTLHSFEAEAQAAECVKMTGLFPNAHDRRALLRAERAVISAYRGRLEDAESIWSEADPLSDPAPEWFDDHRFATDAVAAICRGDGRTVRFLMERNVEIARLWGDAACISQAVSFSTVFCLIAAPNDDVWQNEQRLRAAAERAGDVPDPAEPFVGDPLRPQTGWMGHAEALLALFAAFGQTDVGVAHRLIGECLAACDKIGHGYMQIAARLAGMLALGSERARFVSECDQIAGRMQAPLIQAQIDALIKNQTATGPFSAFLAVLGSARLVGARSVIRVRLLDRKVTRDGKDLRVRQREFELLAHLALAGGPMSVEALCEAVWPDFEEQAAVSSLRMSVHRLRKQLDDPAAVLNATAGYQLASSITVDVLEAEGAFVALRRLPKLNDEDRAALHALFQYLCSLGGDAGIGQSWYERIAHRMEDLRHSAGRLLAKEYLRIGEALAAQEVAEVLLRLDPLDEEAVGLCVMALTAANDKTAAARLWHQYVKRLSSDFGTAPSVSMNELLGSGA